MRGYVLTIEEPGGRRRSGIAAELADVPFPWEFVEGLRKGDPALDELYSPVRNLLYSKRSLAPGEVACYAGHRLIWERIVNGPDPYAIVFEDDASIVDRPAFEQALEDITSHDFDLVKMFDFKPKAVAVEKQVGKTTLVVHKMIASSTACYVISRDAARRMLARRFIYRAVDEDFSHAWEFGVGIWSVWPNPAYDGGTEGSNIELQRNRTRKNRLRSIHGALLQMGKQHRQRLYLRKARAAVLSRLSETPKTPGIHDPLARLSTLEK